MTVLACMTEKEIPIMLYVVLQFSSHVINGTSIGDVCKLVCKTI